jgi:hypothetical protein
MKMGKRLRRVYKIGVIIFEHPILNVQKFSLPAKKPMNSSIQDLN